MYWTICIELAGDHSGLGLMKLLTQRHLQKKTIFAVSCLVTLTFRPQICCPSYFYQRYVYD